MKVLKAEYMKHKRTFARKSLVIVPIIMILLTFLLSPPYFSVTSINWLSIIYMPLMIGLLTHLMVKRDDKARNGLESLPLGQNKLYYSKVTMIALYSLGFMMLYFIFVVILRFLSPQFAFISLSTNVFALSILWLTALWQVPFMLIVGKINSFLALILNIVASFFSTVIAARDIWYLSPWAWSIRAMSPIMGIHPNGLLLEKGDVLWSTAVVSLAIGLSITMTILLVWVGAKQCVRKFS